MAQLAWQVLAQRAIFNPHRLEPTDAVTLRHTCRRADVACGERAPPRLFNEQILHVYAGQPCPYSS